MLRVVLATTALRDAFSSFARVSVALLTIRQTTTSNAVISYTHFRPDPDITSALNVFYFTRLPTIFHFYFIALRALVMDTQNSVNIPSIRAILLKLKQKFSLDTLKKIHFENYNFLDFIRLLEVYFIK